MRKILVVVDMQNDFIDGALGTAEALDIVGNVKERIRKYDPADVFDHFPANKKRAEL